MPESVEKQRTSPKTKIANKVKETSAVAGLSTASPRTRR